MKIYTSYFKKYYVLKRLDIEMVSLYRKKPAFIDCDCIDMITVSSRIENKRGKLLYDLYMSSLLSYSASSIIESIINNFSNNKSIAILGKDKCDEYCVRHALSYYVNNGIRNSDYNDFCISEFQFLQLDLFNDI